jgi:hypothetical protein
MKRLMEGMTELDLEFACALRCCPGRGRPRRPCLGPNVNSGMEKSVEIRIAATWESKA